MNADTIRRLHEYNAALNHRVWDECIARLTDSEYTRDLPYCVGSVRNQALHVATVDMRWLARVKETPLPPGLATADFPDRPSLRARWDAIEADLRAYLRGLTDAEATRPVTYDAGRAGRRTSAIWEVLVHLVNHGTDHRAQILAMLHGLGAPTLEQDLLDWTWERRP